MTASVYRFPEVGNMTGSVISVAMIGSKVEVHD